MKLFLLFSLLALAAINCGITKPNKDTPRDTVKVIGIVDTMPLPSNTGDSIMFYPPEDIKLIYFYKDNSLYRIPHYYSLDSLSFLNDSVIVSTPYFKDTAYFYYAQKVGSNMVFKIDSLTDPNFKKMSVDSLYRWNSVYKAPSFELDKILNGCTKVKTYEDDKFLIETYAAKVKISELFQDSVYLWFSKDKFWKDIPFTYSAHADSIHNLKFVRGKIISNKNPAAKNPYFRNGVQISTEMIQQKITNTKDILNVFERFEQLNIK